MYDGLQYPWMHYRKEDFHESEARAEDPPTRVDGVLRLLAAIGQMGLACVCALAWWLFLQGTVGIAKPLSAALFAAVGVGFVYQAIRNVRRGTQILQPRD